MVPLVSHFHVWGEIRSIQRSVLSLIFLVDGTDQRGIEESLDYEAAFLCECLSKHHFLPERWDLASNSITGARAGENKRCRQGLRRVRLCSWPCIQGVDAAGKRPGDIGQRRRAGGSPH